MPESEELDALYDRFLLRKEVLSVSDTGLLRLLDMPHPGAAPSLPLAGGSGSEGECAVVFQQGLDVLAGALAAAADAVEVHPEVLVLCVFVCIYIYMYVCVYVCMHRERERESTRARARGGGGAS